MTTPASFLFRFKTQAKALVQLSLRSRRKRRPPQASPTASAILADAPPQDEVHPTDEQCAFVVDFDPTMWREILSYCEVIDIVRVGMTCRSLAFVLEDHSVWYAALLRIAHERRLLHLRIHIHSLPSAALRQKAVLSARLDRLSRGLDPRPFPYTTTTFSLQVSVVWAISFLPGGNWLAVLCRKGGEDGVMLCSASDPSGQPSAYTSMPDWNLTGMSVFTSDRGDVLLLLRADRPSATKLGVYLVRHVDVCPSLETAWTDEAPEIEDCAALGNYVVYGWIDQCSTKPRHLVKVSKLASCYRKLMEYCTMEAEWEVSECLHSYGLRITESQVTVVVSSTRLVAAYKIPDMVPVPQPCEPINVRPFWRFSCAYMSPRAVYLVPSLPAVDTPSVIVLYGNRCLFITPSFDADPLQRHPTFFATYAYPRELKRPMLLGPHRALWDLGRGRVAIGMLPTPVTPAFCERGTWDMTGVHAPEGNLANEVQPLGHASLCRSKVARAAWDEESGKLALCPKADSRLVNVVALTS